jgi:hypothetical protein
MKVLIILMICLIIPVHVLAITGVVSEVDVCRNGNVIFKTTSGWYVTARHLSGYTIKAGDEVSGRLKNYGVQIISKPNGQKGNYYILDFKTNRLDAINALCGTGFSR